MYKRQGYSASIVDHREDEMGEDNLNEIKNTIKDRSNLYKYLPGTEKEVKALELITKSKRIKFNGILSDQATEESFKNLSSPFIASPDIIHIGTHGFFLENKSTDSPFKPEINKNVLKENPLFRTGLLFYKNKASYDTLSDDGILTAYEASLLSLNNTKVITLSACETGLGQINGNEGVYGLQRAFLLAGAKNIVMSLWRVDDAVTCLLYTSNSDNSSRTESGSESRS